MASISYHTRVRGGLLVAPLLFSALLAAQSAPPKKAMFWKASSADNVVYLLGSVHIGTKNMYPLPKEIEDAFDRATTLAVEVDFNHLDMQELQAEIAQLGMYPPGDTLWNHIKPETRKALEQFCATYGVPAERFAAMRPWLVSSSTAMLPLLKSGMDVNLAIDKHFMDKAKDKKRIVGIETADAQFKMFAGFPDDAQEQILLESVTQGDKAQDRGKRMADAWLAGDPEALERIGREIATGPPSVQRAVLEDRNPPMADAAEKLLQSKEVGFVMVGAAHMAGKEGIVAILRARGYKVEQVALKP